MDIDLDCSCGNPECHNIASLRKGAVYKAGSNEASHWSELYFMVLGFDGAINSETMLNPKQAKSIMWFMIIHYMPIISYVINWWYSYPYKWFRLYERRK